MPITHNLETLTDKQESDKPFLKYYGFNSNIIYPLYLDNLEFKTYLEDLDKSIRKGLSES